MGDGSGKKYGDKALGYAARGWRFSFAHDAQIHMLLRQMSCSSAESILTWRSGKLTLLTIQVKFVGGREMA